MQHTKTVVIVGVATDLHEVHALPVKDGGMWDYVSLLVNPFEGRLVDVIPTKASVWGKGMRTPRKRDSFTVGHHREQSCCLFNWFIFQFVFGWSSVRSECLRRVEKIVSTWSVSAVG